MPIFNHVLNKDLEIYVSIDNYNDALASIDNLNIILRKNKKDDDVIRDVIHICSVFPFFRTQHFSTTFKGFFSIVKFICSFRVIRFVEFS